MSLALSLSLLALSLTLVSSHGNNSKPNNGQQNSMAMDPWERETLFKVMETMSSDKNWRVSFHDPCEPGSSWFGIECKQGKDGHLHVTKLSFGQPNPSCKNTAIFPSEIFNLPYLQSLSFYNCFRTTRTSLNIPTPPRRTPAADSLQKLSIKSNPALVSIIPPQISTLTSLQILTLSQNKLFGIIPENISSLTSLLYLDLSYNSLSGTIPRQISGLRSLVDLDLSYNSLRGNVPDSLGHLSLLQKLDLSSNSLTGAIPEMIQSLKLLSFLALSNNKLRGPFPSGLERLQNLQYFIMDNNPMFIPLPSQLGRLSKLQELRLANSGYTGTIPGSFAWLKNISTMSLENNRLTGEIPAGIGGLNRIYHLNLSSNNLTGVVPFDDSFLRRLGKNLDLSGNPGLCVIGYGRSRWMSAGVGVCGDEGRASNFQQPVISNAAPSLLQNFSRIVVLTLVYLNLFKNYWSCSVLLSKM